MSSSSDSSSSCSSSVTVELDSRVFCGDADGLRISCIQVMTTLKYSQGINNTKQAIVRKYPIIKCGHRSVSSFRYEDSATTAALWDAARLISRPLCPGNFSLWWVGEENSGFAYANGPSSFLKISL